MTSIFGNCIQKLFEKVDFCMAVSWFSKLLDSASIDTPFRFYSLTFTEFKYFIINCIGFSGEHFISAFLHAVSDRTRRGPALLIPYIIKCKHMICIFRLGFDVYCLKLTSCDSLLCSFVEMLK